MVGTNDSIFQMEHSSTLFFSKQVHVFQNEDFTMYADRQRCFISKNTSTIGGIILLGKIGYHDSAKCRYNHNNPRRKLPNHE
jgi:hypothetical protein